MIRVLLADDQEMMRDAMKLLISNQAEMAVVSDLSIEGDVVGAVRASRPNVTVVSLARGQQGVNIARSLLGVWPELAVIMLYGGMDLEQAYEALQLGVRGHLLKESGINALLQAIRLVATGELVLGPVLSEQLLEASNQLAERAQHPLTGRELEVLKLVAAGHSNRSIALTLIISERTVKAHVASILDKLALEDRTKAALYAQRKGMGSA